MIAPPSLKGRTPLQVKDAPRPPTEKESYPLEVKDLRGTGSILYREMVGKKHRFCARKSAFFCFL